MKNLLLICILLSTMISAQQASLKETPGLYPLYVVNGMVANESQLKALGSSQILAISIYKSDNLPEKLKPFVHFTSEAIIDITLKENADNLDAVSLYRLNLQHKLDELNPVYINRILVQDNSVKILTEAIIETEIIENNSQKFLNIWTLTKEERTGIVKRTGGIKNIPSKSQTAKLQNVK